MHLRIGMITKIQPCTGCGQIHFEIEAYIGCDARVKADAKKGAAK